MTLALMCLLVTPILGILFVGLVPLPGRSAVGAGFAAAVITLGAAVWSSVLAMQAGTLVVGPDVDWVPQLRLHFHLGLDGLSVPLILLTAGIGVLVMVHAWTEEVRRPRAFVSALLLVEVGALGTFTSQDLLLFFVFFEVVLLPTWWLIHEWGGHGRQLAAGRFVLFTLLGSAVMLLGLLVLVATTGTGDIAILSRGVVLDRNTQILVAVLICAGLAVKVPMWPLHTWLPDAHTAAPTAGSVLLAAVLLKMGAYGFARIVIPIVPTGFAVIAPAIAVLAVVGIIWGGLACLAQNDLKRLIAFSSVAHMGFVLLGFATLTGPGLQGALFVNVAHGVITGLLFFVVGAVKSRYGTSDLTELPRALYHSAPHLGALVAFAAVAALGLPGLAGFWGEFLVMYGAYAPAASGPRSLYLVLLGFAAAGTVLATAYSVRIIRRVAQGPVELARPTPDVSRGEWLAWAPLVLGIVVLGLWPQLVLGLTAPVTQALVGGR